MDRINGIVDWVKGNYLLVGTAAVLFFAAKSFVGYLTYKKMIKELHEIKRLIKEKSDAR
ncbi:hypothetical protein [Paenibacillus sp.]|uniref:hypothetical protein n=1 Tax=Paenibacillus sp. TaxID=58172 RepID=UPI002812707D|nr:hypothetical protein [Paenibacillus sp.]